ncbi:MAG: FUSC family protein [Clostridium sp.]|nr:FUSC family protein [Clostridium sp.]
MKKIKKYLPKFRPNWRGALPVVLFFGISFLIVAVFFGLQFVMTASVITVLFQIRHARYNSWGYLFRQLVICEALALFAMIATLDTPLSLLLNFTIPFALVFLQSSQFVPKGYFASAMIFVFLQFMPPEPKDFGIQLEVVLVCWVFLAIVLKLYPYLQRGKKQAKPTVQTLHTGLKQLSQMLTRIADGETDDDFSKELYKLEDTYHRMAYQMQTVFQKGDHGKKCFDMLAVMFQRSFYLVRDKAWQQDEVQQNALPRLTEVAALAEEASQTLNETDNTELIAKARTLLEQREMPEGRVRIFYRSCLHMLILICHTYPATKKQNLQWFGVDWQETWLKFRRRISRHSIETRFALRLSVVLTISCGAMAISHANHVYWFPLNAFLLLQPSFEDSEHRLVTRPIGTALGCLVVALVEPFLPTVPMQFAFAFLMMFFMYCSTPGTWVQPIFSTSFALILASMSMQDNTLIWLRIAYVITAVLLVSVINLFFFPTTKEKQFALNLRRLFQLHASYWEIARRSLSQNVDLHEYNELLTEFHLIYAQCREYIQKELPGETGTVYHELLVTLWKTFSELEQTAYLMQTGSAEREEYPALMDLTIQLQREIFPPQPTTPSIALHRDFHDKDLTYVLTQYMRNSGHLRSLYSQVASNTLIFKKKELARK